MTCVKWFNSMFHTESQMGTFFENDIVTSNTANTAEFVTKIQKYLFLPVEMANNEVTETNSLRNFVFQFYPTDAERMHSCHHGPNNENYSESQYLYIQQLKQYFRQEFFKIKKIHSVFIVTDICEISLLTIVFYKMCL